MITKSGVGVWMDNEERCESVARMIAIDCMMALGFDHVNDFRTRDKIIEKISPRVNRTLDQVEEMGLDLALKKAGIDMESAFKRLQEMIDAKRSAAANV